MKKMLAKVLIAAMLLQLVAVAPAYAQQAAGKKPVAAKPQPVPAPELRMFSWRQLGENPLVPAEYLPSKYGQGDETIDVDTLQRIALDAVGYEKASQLFWVGVSLVFFRGGEVDPRFKKDLQEHFRAGRFVKQTFRKGFVFYPCGMAWGSKDKNGAYTALFTGNPMVDFDDPLEVYMVDPVTIHAGPYYGHTLAVVIPVKCINLTCMDAVEETALYPVEPVVTVETPTAKVKLEKTWLKVNGKKAETPSREDLQLQAEITELPMTADTKPLVVEFFDNKRAEVELKQGQKYAIREVLNTLQWRPVGNDAVEVMVGKDNKPIKFENIEVVEPKPVPPPPTPPVTTTTRIIERIKETEKKGGHKKMWLAIGAAAIGGAVAMFLPKGGGKETVVVEARKGQTTPSNPGGSPP